MSLMERVKQAEKAEAKSVSFGGLNRLEELKTEVQRYISSGEIALIMSENPYRAKNEIRSVCLRVFKDEQWDAVLMQEREKLIDELINTVFGLGPLEDLLADEDITEIMVVGSQKIYFEKEGKIFRSDSSFLEDEQVRALIDRILGPLGRRVDESSPMVNARLKQGHRINVIVPPLALDGPVVTIRKFRERLFTLEEMVSLKSLDDSLKQFLEWAVMARKNIAVSGGTGSGKTTLLNALSCIIPAEERIITIEDSAELKFSHHPHVVRLEARPRNAEGVGEITIRDLVINALRMRPDRIIVGECRGGEALDMLQAMNTGHDGSLTTLHANSPTDALSRLSTMVRYVADLPLEAIEAQIASAINLIVQTARSGEGYRYIQEIASFVYARDKLLTTVETHYQRSFLEERGRWLSIPFWVEELPSCSVAKFEEVAAWKSVYVC